MNNSIFVNPSGLEEMDGSGNLSTVVDMARLMQYAMKNDDFRRITSTKEIVVKSDIKTYLWVNKNRLLFLYESCTGGKTGYTKKANRTLVTTASKDGMNLVVVTFQDGNDFLDHKELYEKYFSKYHLYTAISKDASYGDDVKVLDDFSLMVTDEDQVTIQIERDGSNYPYYGSVVGKVIVFCNGERVGYRYLYSVKQSVTEKKNFLSRLLEFLKQW